MTELMKLVNEQAEDETIWFDAVFVNEMILQKHLRELHSMIEKHFEEVNSHE